MCSLLPTVLCYITLQIQWSINCLLLEVTPQKATGNITEVILRVPCSVYFVSYLAAEWNTLSIRTSLDLLEDPLTSLTIFRWYASGFLFRRTDIISLSNFAYSSNGMSICTYGIPNMWCGQRLMITDDNYQVINRQPACESGARTPDPLSRTCGEGLGTRLIWD